MAIESAGARAELVAELVAPLVLGAVMLVDGPELPQAVSARADSRPTTVARQRTLRIVIDPLRPAIMVFRSIRPRGALFSMARRSFTGSLLTTAAFPEMH
jgi:hypothetical protein